MRFSGREDFKEIWELYKFLVKTYDVFIVSSEFLEINFTIQCGRRDIHRVIMAFLK